MSLYSLNAKEVSLPIAMAVKYTQLHLFSVILWLSLYLLFFGWCHLFDISHQVSTSHHHHHNRKVLATKFDFTPFLHHKHQSQVPVAHPQPSGNDIDPRYGVEKRLVPTGPNPLHH
ncbi:hypothetical protein ERO13_D07G042900v2 [Gossypium hirsutum]|nr:hypothetical protein ERO13_D07G042900v2 [Gossypium hirsutum]